MRAKRLKVFAAIAALGLGIAAVPATSALATETRNCGTRTDYLKIYQLHGVRKCYAFSGGTWTVDLHDVWMVTSGNNKVDLHYNSIYGNGKYKRLAKFQTFRPSGEPSIKTDVVWLTTFKID